MTYSSRSVLTVLSLAASLPALPAQPAFNQPTLGVKVVTRPVSSTSREGLVTAVDEDGLILLEPVRGHKPVRHQFVPIDVLRDGKVLPGVLGSYAYRWQDIKVGDTVDLNVLKDDGDGLTYCLQVSIRRRPGEKLPQSQMPDKDDRYNAARILNEIENGNDVSDEELLKEWPPKFDTKAGKRIGGGLPPSGWSAPIREKLDANRERIAKEKEKGLKAKPADGKLDPRRTTRSSLIR